MRRRAFTLIELVVAIALLAVIVAIAAIIFRVALTSYRLAGAHAEIMGKLRLLTQQIDDDFSGIRFDAPIIIGWTAQEDPNRLDGYRSADRIVFFSEGRESFQAIGHTNAPITEGSLARITYMLATVSGQAPDTLSARERILARTQHIMAPPLSTTSSIAEANDSPDWWFDWNNDRDRQYDDRYYRTQAWLNMDPARLYDAIRAWIDMDPNTYATLDQYGTQVDVNDPGTSLHKILCQGVGQFRIQGWYEDAEARWVPEPNDPNESRETDLVSESGQKIRTGMLLYPYNPLGDDTTALFGSVHLGGEFAGQDYRDRLLPSEVSKGRIPGLGRAFRFTFTLFDSKGLIENGMTFTHIVYLDR